MHTVARGLPNPLQPVLLGTPCPLQEWMSREEGRKGPEKSLGVSVDFLGGRLTLDAKFTLPTPCTRVSLNLEGEAESSFLLIQGARDTWLAQSVEHMTLDLEVMSSNPMLSIEITLKKFFLNK